MNPHMNKYMEEWWEKTRNRRDWQFGIGTAWHGLDNSHNTTPTTCYFSYLLSLCLIVFHYVPFFSLRLIWHFHCSFALTQVPTYFLLPYNNFIWFEIRLKNSASNGKRNWFFLYVRVKELLFIARLTHNSYSL